MQYVINDIILFIISISLLYYLQKENYKNAVIISVFAYCCAPVIKIQDIGINPSYLFTGILGIWLLKLMWEKKINWSRTVFIFVGGMGTSILIVGISWLLNAQYQVSHLIHFMGMTQWALGVVALYILYTNNEMFQQSLYWGIKGVIVWNFILTILQIFIPKIGIVLTKLLYTYTGKDAAINTTENVGRFLRGFGSFYSSTETGGFCLFTITLVLLMICKQKIWKKELPFLFMILFVGLFAFSKAVIIGVFVIFLLLVGLIILLKVKVDYRKMLCSFFVTLLAFFVVIVLGKSVGLSGQVDYYFGKLLNPFSVFETRYGDLDKSDKIISDTANSGVTAIEGNLEKTIEVIRKNIIIGVGPASVEGEFVGDSQFVVSLHDGGIINFSICCFLYIFLFIKGWKEKTLETCILIGIVAMECLFIPVFSCAYAIPFIAWCLVVNKRSKEINEKVCNELL